MPAVETPPRRATRQTVERLVSTYADLVVRLSYARLGSIHDAQDVCQTVFLKLLGQADAGKASFADAEHEKAWVIRVTLNACADVLRSGWRTKVVPLDPARRADEDAPCPEGRERGDADEPSCGPGPNLAREQQDLQRDPTSRACVLEAVNALSPTLRCAIYLHYYEGYSTEEIARLTGDTPDTVRKHLSRGRAKLRDALEGEGL